jgi:uncharacterized protein (TIGR03118 family)
MLLRGSVSSLAVALLAGFPCLPQVCHAAGFSVTNLVSDDTSIHPAVLADPHLKNAWGIAATGSSPFWTGDNGAGLSTLYGVNPTTGVPTKTALEVTIPGDGSITGLVNNPGSGSGAFNSDNFLFVSEDGTISGWRNALGTVAEILQTPVATNVYKGVTAATVSGHTYLYAANFHTGAVNVLKGDAGAPSLAGNFTDPGLPAGYAPFGIQNLGGSIYVTYALTDATAHDDVPGAGHGFVSQFDLQGNFVGRIATAGALNSPWGLALAPSSFGAIAGDLLVGNFGDGTINVFNPTTHAPLGPLTDSGGQPLVIDGLWALFVGNNGSGGSSNNVYFSAGPNDEAHGVFGVIQAVPEPASIMLLGCAWVIVLGAGRRRRGGSK